MSGSQCATCSATRLAVAGSELYNFESDAMSGWDALISRRWEGSSKLPDWFIIWRSLVAEDDEREAGKPSKRGGLVINNDSWVVDEPG